MKFDLIANPRSAVNQGNPLFCLEQQQRQGGGMGKHGQGRGGKAPISPTPTGTKLQHSPSQTTAGDIIARQFVDGPVIVGESNAQIKAIAAVISEGFDEAQADDQVPPKYWHLRGE